MTEGWKCPNCGKAHAPDVKTCPEPASAQPVPYVPTYPREFHDGPRMPLCGCEYGSVCMNAACPHRTIITCQAGDPHNANGGTSYSAPL